MWKDAEARISRLTARIEEENLAVEGMGKEELEKAAKWIRLQGYILSQISDVVVAIDLEKRFIYWNHAAEKLYGVRAEEILGKPRDEGYRQQWLKEGDYDACMAELAKNGFWQGELIHIKRNGEKIDIEAKVNIIQDERGNRIGYLAVVQDITELKRAQMRAMEWQIRYETAITASGQMLYDWNLETGEVVFGGEYERITGYTKEEVPKTLDECYALIHPDDRAAFGESVKNDLQRKGAADFECRILRKDGEYIHIKSGGIYYEDPVGKKPRQIGFLVDETKYKQLLTSEHQARTEAELANRAKDDFLAVLSHELRTPLTPVLLTVSLLESYSELPEELKEDIQMIRRNVELEARLIDDLLDLTRIVKGKLKFEMQKCNLHDLIRNATDICACGNGAKIELELGAEHCHVHGDSGRLQQVFWNLLNNAKKFTPTDGKISMRSSDMEDGRIKVEVRDTGMGIEPEILPKIFHPFEQGHFKNAKHREGLGLGLAIAKAIMDAHQGVITASSDGKGKGVCITVELPTVSAPAREEDSCAAPIGEKSVAHKKSRLGVLVVDDHEWTLKILSRLLTQSGYDVYTAKDGQSALKEAAARSIDLLISDLGLPDMSGHELMVKLKQRQKIKGIILSGHGTEEDVLKSREVGFSEHLTKPVAMHQLEAAIKRAWERTTD